MGGTSCIAVCPSFLTACTGHTRFHENHGVVHLHVLSHCEGTPGSLWQQLLCIRQRRGSWQEVFSCFESAKMLGVTRSPRNAELGIRITQRF